MEENKAGGEQHDKESGKFLLNRIIGARKTTTATTSSGGGGGGMRRLWKKRKRRRKEEGDDEEEEEREKNRKERPAFLDLNARSTRLQGDREEDDEGILRETKRRLELDDEEDGGGGGGSRLMKIVSGERRRMHQEEEDERKGLERVEEEEGESGRSRRHEKKNFFDRGTSFVRRSLRRMSAARRKDRDGDEEVKKSTLLRLEEGNNDSQDSGLGEDSDFCDTSRLTGGGGGTGGSSGTTPRTPTPGAASSSAFLPSSLRKSSSSASSSTADGAHHPGKQPPTASVRRHVVIREPSLANLPSAVRRARPQQPPPVTASVHQTRSFRCRRETARVFSRPSRLPPPPPAADAVSATRGSVSSQWEVLYSAALSEVRRAVPSCDPDCAALVFSPDRRGALRDLEALSSPESVSVLIHSVYHILFHRWPTGSSSSAMVATASPHLALIVHCVQRFLVLVVDVAGAELEAEARCRFASAFRTLLRRCEADCYSDVARCLRLTRGIYVEFWVALLCEPFGEVEEGEEAETEGLSPSLGAVRKKTELLV